MYSEIRSYSVNTRHAKLVSNLKWNRSKMDEARNTRASKFNFR